MAWRPFWRSCSSVRSSCARLRLCATSVSAVTALKHVSVMKRPDLMTPPAACRLLLPAACCATCSVHSSAAISEEMFLNADAVIVVLLTPVPVADAVLLLRASQRR